MTEYDYSPDAYERYLSTQDRVSRWVHKQANHAPEYSNPFIDPSAAHDYPRHDTHHRDRDGGRSGSSSRHGSISPTSTSRPPPKRSQTTPVPVMTSSAAYHQPSSRVVSPTSRYQPTHHQSYSTQQVYQYPTPVPQVSYISSGSGYKSAATKTMTYTMDTHTGELHLPPPRYGEQYIIIPPKGRTVQVIHEHSDGSRSSSRSSRSPTKRDEPLLKRLFHIGGGDGHKPQSSRTSSTRRQRRLSH